MKKDSTRFLITILVVSIILVAIDVTVGIVCDKAMDKLPNYSGQLTKDNYRLHRLETDIVIIGSSRGAHHYVTQQLSDSIDAYYGKHVSLYNAAIDGKFANSNCCAAEAILARYSPKLVIFDLPENQLRGDKVADIEFSSPFYWKDSLIHRYLDNISVKESILMKSSLYRYNGKLFRIAVSMARTLDVDDGYLPLYGTSIDTLIYGKKEEPLKPIDSYKWSNFESVLKKYATSNVPLVMACSPRFRPNDNNQQMAKLCEKYGIPFIDIYDTPYYNAHPELFKDGSHLNDDGAHIYTAIFFEQLKQYLPNL